MAQHGWRVVWRWQNRRAVGGEDVRDAHPLRHRGSGDLQGRRSHDDVAALRPPPRSSRTAWRPCPPSSDAAARAWAGLPTALAFPVERSSGPIGVTGMPRPSIQSRKSGGTHRRTSWPSALNSNASATSGWTSPRDPIVDSSTRIPVPPFGLGPRRGITDHPAARVCLLC